MNRNFLEIISANTKDRHDLFLATANRLGTTLQNIKKDFWVSWISDLLFNGRNSNEPRLLFKGGTSLSKAYSLIARFSENGLLDIFWQSQLTLTPVYRHPIYDSSGRANSARTACWIDK